MALSAPTMCPRGFFSNKDGNKLCTPCPVNTASTVVPSLLTPVAITTCPACTRGLTTRGLTGQSLCQAVRVQALRRKL